MKLHYKRNVDTLSPRLDFEVQSAFKKLIKEKINKKNNEKLESFSSFFTNNREVNVSFYSQLKQKNILISEEQAEVDISTRISLFKKTSNLIIKPAKLNLCYLVNKKKVEFNSAFFTEIKNYFLWMIRNVVELESSTTYSFNIYSVLKYNSIPFYVIYNKKENYTDELEENLFSQRKYFMDVFSFRNITNIEQNDDSNNHTNFLDSVEKEQELFGGLASNYPLLKTNQLEVGDYSNEYNSKYSGIDNEIPYSYLKYNKDFANMLKKSMKIENTIIIPNEVKNSKVIISPHKILFRELYASYQKSQNQYQGLSTTLNDLSVIIKNHYIFNYGDFCFYNIGNYDFPKNIKQESKYSMTGYLALQTLISWLCYNGILKVDVPSFSVIKKLIKYLKNNDSEKKENNDEEKEKEKEIEIDLNDISLILGYYVDLQIDILEFKNLKDFSQSLELLERHLTNHGSLILLQKEEKSNKRSIIKSWSKEVLRNIMTVFSVNSNTNSLGILEHTFSDNTQSILSLKRSSK